jgi:MFS family permease
MNPPGKRERLARVRRGGHSDMFRSMRNKNFRNYLIGQAIGQSGMWMQTVATTVVALTLTDSGLVIGLVVAVQWAPMLVLGPWAGALADRFDRRKILLWAQVLGLLAAAGMAVVVLADLQTIPLIMLLTAAIGIVNAIETPSRVIFASDLAEPDDLMNAVGLNASILTGSRVTGPLLAGAIIVLVGPAWCFVAHAVSKIPQFVLINRIDPDSIRPVSKTARGRGQVREGLAHAWHSRDIRSALVVMATVAFFAFNHNTVLPLMAITAYDSGPTAYTIMFASMSLGSVLGGLFLARRTVADLRFLAMAAAGLGVSYIGIAAAPGIVTGTLLSVPIGFFYLMMGGGTNIILQLHADPAMRGRVVALLPVVSNGLSPLGGPLIGYLSDEIGIRTAVTFVSIPCVLIGALVLLKPARVDKPEQDLEASVTTPLIR